MESIDFRHYRWESWMSIHTIVQAGSVHDHVQGLAGKWQNILAGTANILDDRIKTQKALDRMGQCAESTMMKLIVVAEQYYN